MDTIWWSGSQDARINLVFLGDGYQESELDKYITDVHMVVDHFFMESPFKEYKPFFNILAIKVPSEDSGAKKDAFDQKNTYFQSAYNFAGIERLLVAGRLDRAQEVLFDLFPLFDQAVLIVNDPKYGGSGGWLATTSVHVNAPEIALHEIGHSFAGLADEYWAGDQFASERPNMTRQRDPSEIKWKNWLGYKDVNIYPHTENPSWFRPHQNCKMRFLDPDFCPVCTETIVKRIHQLVNFVDGFNPDSSDISINVNDSIHFIVEAVNPIPNTIKTLWSVNDQLVSTNESEYVLYANNATDHSLQVEVSVQDTTAYIRDSVHQQRHTELISWQLQNDQATSNKDFTGEMGVLVYPNPANDLLQIQIDGDMGHVTYPLKIEIIGIDGQLKLESEMWQNPYELNLNTLRSGGYLLKFSKGEKYHLHPIVKQ